MNNRFLNGFKLDFSSLFQPTNESEKKARWILLLTPILLTVWVYFGKRFNFAQYFASSGRFPTDAAAVIFEYLAFFLLMFCVPALLIKLAWKQPLSEYGLQWGDWHAGLRIVALILPVMLLGAYTGAYDPGMQAEYPLAKTMMQSIPLFIVVELFYLVYYFAWEFFFRGFLQIGMQKAYGPVMAILIQTVPSAIVHIGKPFAECFSAILAGLVFGYAAWRTRSIFFSMLLHAVVGISTDLIITFLLR
jgi:membrane protease YdiL (CAAX protease family)